MLDPVVGGLVGTVDGVTGDALSPVTGVLTDTTDATTDVLDDVLDGELSDDMTGDEFDAVKAVLSGVWSGIQAIPESPLHESLSAVNGEGSHQEASASISGNEKGNS